MYKVGNIGINTNFIFPYKSIYLQFSLFIPCDLVNVKLDVSGYKTFRLEGCRLHVPLTL